MALSSGALLFLIPPRDVAIVGHDAGAGPQAENASAALSKKIYSWYQLVLLSLDNKACKTLLVKYA